MANENRVPGAISFVLCRVPTPRSRERAGNLNKMRANVKALREKKKRRKENASHD